MEKAIYFYKFAAENGLRLGYYKAGCCYNKMGGEENVNKAIMYFKIGGKENDPLTKFELAGCQKKSTKEIIEDKQKIFKYSPYATRS